MCVMQYVRTVVSLQWLYNVKNIKVIQKFRRYVEQIRVCIMETLGTEVNIDGRYTILRRIEGPAGDEEVYLGNDDNDIFTSNYIFAV